MHPAAPHRTVALGAATGALLLLLAAPTPAASVRTLRHAGAAADQATPLVALLSLLAWLLAGWLLLTLAVTAGGHLPGLAGRVMAGAARCVAPAAVRRAVELALGLTVVVGALASSPAVASPGPGAGPAAPAGVSLDWPAPPATRSQAPGPSAADLDWAAAAVPTADSAEPVVVQPGDSLWQLAERDLAARGEPTTDAAVAQAWPTWWAANRDAIGADPDVIHPGTSLSPPPASS